MASIFVSCILLSSHISESKYITKQKCARQLCCLVIQIFENFVDYTFLILLLSWDVELNPGPADGARVCDMCLLPGRKNQIFISCSVCQTYFHKTCVKLNGSDYQKIVKGHVWACWKCSLPQFSDSFFGLDNVLLQDSSRNSSVTDIGKENLNQISLLSFNSRSLKCSKRRADIEAFIAMHNSDILCVCETWLDSSILDGEILPNDYLIFRRDRQNATGGGVLLAIKPEFCPTRKLDLETRAEVVWVEITVAGFKLLVGSAYRAPSASEDTNNELLLSIDRVQSICHSYKAIILCGDFNINVSWRPDGASIPNDSTANRFVTSFYGLFLTQMVHDMTRVSNSSSSLLDLVLCNDPSLVNKVDVIPGVSDHRAVKVILSLNKPKCKKLCKKVFNYNKANWELLSDLLWNNLPTVWLNNDVESAWFHWSSIFMDCVQKAIPTVVIRGKKRSPWITREMVKQIKKRDHLFKKWKFSPSNERWERYRVARNRIKSLLRRSKSEYLWNVGETNNSKELWRLIHNRHGSAAPTHDYNGERLVKPCEVAAAFSNKFKSNFSVQDSNQDLCFLPGVSYHMKLSHLYVTTDEVLHRLHGIKPASATGPDNIPGRILHHCAAAIAPSLCGLYNLSLRVGIIPSQWKIANVVPIFKSGSREDVNNYRPISLTSIVCKVLERLVSAAVLKHFQENKFIVNNQHGFLPRRSCITMLTQLIDDWLYILDQRKGSQIDVVSLDWSKAFDTVPHHRLLKKLEIYGIGGVLLSWVKSFLCQRLQTVIYDGAYSNCVDVTSGVPQGSVLGPLLFVVYMLDLPRCVTSTVVQYADDSIFYRTVKNEKEANALQSDLKNIEVWCRINLMSINSDKSCILHLTRAKHLFLHHYTYDNEEIPVKKSLKLLGVYISDDLKWNLHTEIVRAKASKLLGFVYRNLKDCTARVKRTVYLTLIRPILLYGSPAWHPNNCENMKKLESVQNRATRLILSSNDSDSSSRRLQCRIQSMECMFKQIDIIYLKKTFLGLIDFDPLKRAFLNYRSVVRGNGVLIVPPFAHTNAYQNAYVCRSAKEWNTLPVAVRSTWQKDEFVSMLRCYYS